MGHQTGQPAQRIALIDGNSFYASCERVMRPALMGKPVIVLSNNDGCAIARTAEAKAMGIKMGAPWFQIKHLEADGLVALSANFALYGDLSDRMMRVIGQFSPRQEIYSIDESFLDLTGVPGAGRQIGTAIRERVAQWVGIPTCVGIGASKTLAKLANHLSKSLPKLQGVCDLSGLSGDALMRAIRHVPVEEVWGVGRKLAPRLKALDIHTAADLARADPRVIRDRFSVVLLKTARELAGESCIDWEESPPAKQQIMCSRSFGRPVQEMEGLSQALSLFTSRAAEKLRAQGSKTTAIHVFARTSFFRQGPQYSGNVVVPLPHATDSTPVLIAAAKKGLRKFYKPGVDYAKAGVCLLDVVSAQEAHAQGELGFDDESQITAGVPETSRAMLAIDKLNTRFGRSTVQFASSLHQATDRWLMRQERMSPNYTTRWEDLVEVWR
ncbi:Y-family DNA polymerase [Alcaligenes faecalis subsp. phenolicus]|uniref:Y-family DNA polymerase n=1 Tax=Alcaligenes nematophilus TaxID=2994643 RepID=UPI002AA302CD|nr:Y-family DNA polymerase [Alcaligenes phenolicus]